MRKLSTNTKELIDQLLTPQSSWDKVFHRRDNTDLLIEIGEANEPAAIPYLLSFTLSDNPITSNLAAKVIHRMMEKVAPSELIWLDQYIREVSPYGLVAKGWHGLIPEGLKRLLKLKESTITILGLASFHPNGYVREAALKALKDMSNGEEIPFLLLRLNDWVAQIRRFAKQIIGDRLTPQYAKFFVTNLSLVLHLQNYGRDDHSDTVSKILGILKSEEGKGALLNGIKSQDKFVKRHSYKVCLESPYLDTRSIIKQALEEKDTVIRYWAARQVCSNFDGDELNEQLSRLMKDSSMPVRRESLYCLINKYPEFPKEELEKALLDQHISMREIARYYLKKDRERDFVAFYRTALQENKNLYATLSGLGETGSISDAELLIPYCSIPNKKVRRAAIRGLSALSENQFTEIFVEALIDSRPTLSGEARNALLKKARHVSSEEYWNIFCGNYPIHVKRNTLFLISKQTKWKSIPFLIKATVDPNKKIAEIAVEYLRKWLCNFNRQAVNPSKEEIKNFSNTFNTCGYNLPKKIKEDLQDILKIL